MEYKFIVSINKDRLLEDFQNSPLKDFIDEINENIQNLTIISNKELTIEENGLLYQLIRNEKNRSLAQQIQQQEFGAVLAIELVNLMGGRNLLLSSQGRPANIPGLLATLGSVKQLIETGALKTARNFLIGQENNYPEHKDIISYGIEKITTFLKSKNWD